MWDHLYTLLSEHKSKIRSSYATYKLKEICNEYVNNNHCISYCGMCSVLISFAFTWLAIVRLWWYCLHIIKISVRKKLYINLQNMCDQKFYQSYIFSGKVVLDTEIRDVEHLQLNIMFCFQCFTTVKNNDYCNCNETNINGFSNLYLWLSSIFRGLDHIKLAIRATVQFLILLNCDYLVVMVLIIRELPDLTSDKLICFIAHK